MERSSDQVVKPINLEALSKWVGQIPDDVVRDMSQIAPMLATLGYDPDANPPNYGQADIWVANNTLDVVNNENKWFNKTQQLLKGKKEMQQLDAPDDWKRQHHQRQLKPLIPSQLLIDTNYINNNEIPSYKKNLFL